MKISDKTKRFLKMNKDLLQTNNYKKLYDTAWSLDPDMEIWPEVCFALIDAGVDPEDMIADCKTEIPELMFRFTNITDIRIPEGVTQIGMAAFSDCRQLKEVQLPSTLKVIEITAFERCTSLEKIILPNNLERIWNLAFGGCFNLKEIKLPESIQVITGNTFQACPNLTIYAPLSAKDRVKKALEVNVAGTPGLSVEWY